MKNTLTKILIAILCVLSVCTILISDAMMQARTKGVTSIYPLLLPVAVAFLHWVFMRYYIPFSPSEENERIAAKAEAKKFYVRSLFAGTIGFGYLAILSYLFIWFLMADINSEHRHPGNPVPLGIIFISIGLLAHVHGHLKYFISEKRK